MAIFEEIPDRSQVDASIWVLGSEGSDLASPQQLLQSWVKSLRRHFFPHSLRPIGQAGAILLPFLSPGASPGRPHSVWAIGNSFLKMYGPPPECKKNWVGREAVCENVPDL